MILSDIEDMFANYYLDIPPGGGGLSSSQSHVGQEEKEDVIQEMGGAGALTNQGSFVCATHVMFLLCAPSHKR